MGDLLRAGCDLRSWISDRGVHVSGHAHAAEQRRMIDLVRPKSFVPVHGTLHHLHRHADLARGCGVPEVTILENGDVGILGEHGLRKDGRVQSGRVHVWAGRAIPPSVLRERQAIAQEGVALVVVTVDARGTSWATSRSRREASSTRASPRGSSRDRSGTRATRSASSHARAPVGPTTRLPSPKPCVSPSADRSPAPLASSP